jgi:hypothetical protein
MARWTQPPKMWRGRLPKHALVQRWHPAPRCTRMKAARVILQIEPTLKAAGEKAAAADHRSLNGLIEMLLADYCEKQATAESLSSPSRSDAAPRAAEMAASTIDRIGDKTVPAEEQQRRKRRLIRGPKEFRDIHRK